MIHNGVKFPEQVQTLAISELKPYEKNSRTHSDAQVKQIMASMKEFGFTNPVLIDEHSNVIAGHGRIMAAKKLKLELVPVVQIRGLTESQRRAYVIADNQLALNAGWNAELLKSELQELEILDFDLEVIGFPQMDLELILADGNFDAGSEDDQGQLDEKDMIFLECPHCRKQFEKGQARVVKN